MTDALRFERDIADERALERWGAWLAGHLPDGAVVSLVGTLGAGKTRLVQAVASACGVDRRDVVSPTFVLCQTHHGRRTLHHLDAYRLRDDDEFLELGVDELFASPALTFVEWGDRFDRCLPEERVEVKIEVTGPTTRRIVVSLLDSPALADLIDGLRRATDAED